MQLSISKLKTLGLKNCIFTKTNHMAEEMVIKIRDKKVYRILDKLIEKKMITVVNKTLSNFTPAKKKLAKDFLTALNDARLAEKGKLKLKTAQSLLNEL